MSYNDLLSLLLCDDVYNILKLNEEELFELVPELKNCKGFEQNSKWHIYDVYEHILHVVSEVEPNIYLRLAALFHDIAKPLTYTRDESGVGHFYNHWTESVKIFEKYQSKFDLSKKEISLISNLIFYHDINVEKMNDQEQNNMLCIIGSENIELLFSLKRADLLAQSPVYHGLLDNINRQEQDIIKIKK